jgi:hypothetical protein
MTLWNVHYTSDGSATSEVCLSFIICCGCHVGGYKE